MAEVSTAKTLGEKADQTYKEGDFEAAAGLYGEAAAVFQSAGSQVDAAEMKNNQSVAFLQAGNAQAALDAAAGTAGVFAAAGDARRQAIALANEATPLEFMGRRDEAVEKYTQAAEAFGQAGEDQLRANVMQAVAGIHLRERKIFLALADARSGLTGVKHPTLTQKILGALLRIRIW